MDQLVRVRRSMLARIRSFLNVFAEQCKTCLRRSPENCMDCYSVIRARELMAEIDGVRNVSEERYFVDHPMMEKCARIVNAVRQADRPLMSNEIFLDGASKQHKHMLLKKLVGLGVLELCGSSMSSVRTYGKGPRFNSFRTTTQHTTNKKGK